MLARAGSRDGWTAVQGVDELIKAAAERDSAFRECLNASERKHFDEVLAKLASQARTMIQEEKNLK